VIRWLQSPAWKDLHLGYVGDIVLFQVEKSARAFAVAIPWQVHTFLPGLEVRGLGHATPDEAKGQAEELIVEFLKRTGLGS
jgi:hypothetical protein